MTKKTTEHGELREGIERLVREYIATIRLAAEGAVARAVSGSIGYGVPIAKKRAQSRELPSGKQRPTDELGELSQRLYEAMCRTPGETMLVLAPIVGSTPRELNRPMHMLKRAGRIRSVGTRATTRYFPMASRASD